ncbi:hypothetical protein ACFVIZ_20185 [Streptomyces anulatus]|uniref:hypothetical protein n=1 Tax=Streptomyces anulatus TaxID=1892 RepID=UPI003631EB20
MTPRTGTGCTNWLTSYPKQAHDPRNETTSYADLATVHADLSAFDDLDVVFNYARDDEQLPFGTGTLRDVGPDPLAPGRRLHMTVVDRQDSFRTLLRHDAATGDARLLGLYRQALYGLAFEPDACADSLAPQGAGA